MTTGEYESITESAVYHYVDGLRLTTPTRLWELAQQINGGVFEGRATVLKRSVLEALPELEADVVYLDPPYPGVMSYEREYKTIDEILEGTSRPTSPFTAKDGHNMIDGLLERATHIPIWILSLGNAVVGVEELESKMAKHSRQVKSIALRYQHLPAVATEEKKRENKEFIVVGVDEGAALFQAHVRRLDDPHAIAVVEVDTGGSGSQGASLESLPNDPLDQCQPDVAKLGLPIGAIGEGSHGIDHPHSGFVKGSIDCDGEDGFRLGAHDATASLGTDSHVKENVREPGP